MSQNSIAVTRNMSKSSVSEVCKIADDKQIRFADVKDLSDDEVSASAADPASGCILSDIPDGRQLYLLHNSGMTYLSL